MQFLLTKTYSNKYSNFILGSNVIDKPISTLNVDQTCLKLAKGYSKQILQVSSQSESILVIDLILEPNEKSTIEYLHQAGARINRFSLVKWAIIKDLPDIFHYILEAHHTNPFPSPSEDNLYRNFPQLFAHTIISNRPQMAKYIIDFHLNHESYALAELIAGRHNQLEILTYLVELGADNHNEALIDSFSFKDFSTISYLISVGADVNYDHPTDKTPIYQAITYRSMDVVEYLGEMGARIDTSNPILIKQAIRSGSELKMQYLVKMGVELSSLQKPIVEFALRSIALNSSHSHLIRFLVENGADIHYDNELALLCTFANSSVPFTKLLLELGADLSRVFKKCTRESIRNQSQAHLQILLDNGIKIASIPGISYHVSKLKSPLMIQMFLDEGLDPQELLNRATFNGNEVVIETVLKSNPNLRSWNP